MEIFISQPCALVSSGKKKVKRFSDSHETKWDCKYKDINCRDAVWETRYLLSCLASLLLFFFCCCHDSAKLDWYLGTSRWWYSNWNLSGVSSENKNKQQQQQHRAYLIFIHRSQFFSKISPLHFCTQRTLLQMIIFFPPCSKDKQINTLQNQLSAGKRVLHNWKQLNDLFLPVAQLKLECETVDLTLTVSHTVSVTCDYIYTVYIYT